MKFNFSESIGKYINENMYVNENTYLNVTPLTLKIWRESSVKINKRKVIWIVKESCFLLVHIIHRDTINKNEDL